MEGIKKTVGDNSDQFELIFAYLLKFEEAEQLDAEQSGRGRIGYKK